MGHIIDEHDVPRRPVGRPKESSQTRSVEKKIRIEPYLDEQLTIVCTYLGISKSEAIRQGIQLFLKEAKKLIY